MERDVVCGMQVDPAKAAGKSEYNGKTYYFCSSTCKTRFDADPGKYAANSSMAMVVGQWAMVCHGQSLVRSSRGSRDYS